MGFKTTGVLAVLLLALLGYLYFYEKGEPGRRAAEEQTNRLLQVRLDRVTGLTIGRAEDTIAAVKGDQKWNVLRPLETEGDWSTFEGLVRTAENLERARTVADSVELVSGRVSLQDYGLAQPALWVVLAQKDLGADTLFFGDEIPTGGHVYVRRAGYPEVLLTETWRKTQFDKTLFDLRDKRLVPFDLDAVEKLELVYGDREIVAGRKSGFWFLEKPVKDRGDDATIQAALRRLQTARVRAFVEEEAEDPAAYGLDDPQMRLSLFEGKDLAEKTLLIGDKTQDGRATQYYGQYTSLPRVFAVDSTLVGELQKTPSDFRDKEIFSFDRENVDRVVLVYPDSTVECRRDMSAKEGWVVVSPPSREVPGFRVENLIDSAKNLMAEQFVAEEAASLAPYGLDRPDLHVQMFAGDERVQEIRMAKKDGQIYAKGDGRPQVVTLSDRNLERLKLDLIRVSTDTAGADSVRTEVE